MLACRKNVKSRDQISDTLKCSLNSFKTGRVWSPGQNSQLIHDPPYYRNQQINLSQKIPMPTIRMLFEVKSVNLLKPLSQSNA